MGIPAVIDQVLQAHGNWAGLSIGYVVTVWLAHILSEANHHLNHVQPWAAARLGVLAGCLSAPELRDLDFTDDRLALILERLAGDDAWEEIETLLYRGLVTVYDLKQWVMRIDTTTSSSFREVVEGGLFQQGFSKGPRKELPIMKILQATLDPMALPVVTAILPGLSLIHI